MTTISDEAVEKTFSKVLEQAVSDGAVRIRRSDGQEFIIRPVTNSGLDVGFVSLDPPITLEDILAAIRDGHEHK